MYKRGMRKLVLISSYLCFHPLHCHMVLVLDDYRVHGC